MKNFNVALLQLMPEDSLEGNLKKGIAACRKAKEMDADLALFPEMWSTGYHIPENGEGRKAYSVSADSPFVQTFGRLAKELDMAIGITFLEEYQPLPRNSLCLFDRFGNRKFLYAKVHTCDFGEESRLTAGDDFYVADLDTTFRKMEKAGRLIPFLRIAPLSKPLAGWQRNWIWPSGSLFWKSTNPCPATAYVYLTVLETGNFCTLKCIPVILEKRAA